MSGRMSEENSGKIPEHLWEELRKLNQSIKHGIAHGTEEREWVSWASAPGLKWRNMEALVKQLENFSEGDPNSMERTLEGFLKLAFRTLERFRHPAAVRGSKRAPSFGLSLSTVDSSFDGDITSIRRLVLRIYL